MQWRQWTVAVAVVTAWGCSDNAHRSDLGENAGPSDAGDATVTDVGGAEDTPGPKDTAQPDVQAVNDVQLADVLAADVPVDVQTPDVPVVPDVEAPDVQSIDVQTPEDIAQPDDIAPPEDILPPEDIALADDAADADDTTDTEDTADVYVPPTGCLADSDCADDNPCSFDLCLPGGACDHPPAYMLPCNDGDACTDADHCSDVGTCVGTGCDDGIDCTTDACAVGVGCSHDPVHALCEDGNLCTDDTCDIPTGGCLNAANTATCDDGNACTTGDTCQAKSCVPASEKICTASDACHVAGTCDTTTGVCTNPEVDTFTPCPMINAAAMCAMGQCMLTSCNKGWEDCDLQGANGCEANLTNDQMHCGSCSKSCFGLGETCVNGQCGCGAGTYDCGLQCKDLCSADTAYYIERFQDSYGPSGNKPGDCAYATGWMGCYGTLATGTPCGTVTAGCM